MREVLEDRLYRFKKAPKHAVYGLLNRSGLRFFLAPVGSSHGNASHQEAMQGILCGRVDPPLPFMHACGAEVDPLDAAAD